MNERINNVRARMVALARDCIGWDCGDPYTRPDFERLIGPAPTGARWPLDLPYLNEPHGRPNGMSTCAMVAMGLLRRLGPGSDAVMAPYKPGDGLDVAIQFAKECGAWQMPVVGADLRPEPGDIVQLVGPMHALVCVDWDGDMLVSVDGGQVGKTGLQAIKERRRPWELRGGVPWLGGRRVDGWIALDLLRWTA